MLANVRSPRAFILTEPTGGLLALATRRLPSLRIMAEKKNWLKNIAYAE